MSSHPWNPFFKSNWIRILLFSCISFPCTPRQSKIYKDFIFTFYVFVHLITLFSFHFITLISHTFFLSLSQCIFNLCRKIFLNILLNKQSRCFDLVSEDWRSLSGLFTSLKISCLSEIFETGGPYASRTVWGFRLG